MSILDNQYRHLLKVHEDVLTIHEAINELYDEYKELGYRMHLKLPSSFSYYLEDSTLIMVYWEEGKIYENLAKFKLPEKPEGQMKSEKELKNQMMNLLELEAKEEDAVRHYLLNHSISYFFNNYFILRLSESANQKIEALKLIVR